MKQRSMEQALERLSIIERRLAADGPYHLGERFSLVDVTMAYWAMYMESGNLLSELPAVRACFKLVENRPKLQPKFDEAEDLRVKYAKLQAKGAGLN